MIVEYKRKFNNRELRTNERFLDAIEANGKMGVNAVSKIFGIPAPTLRKWMKHNDYSNKIFGSSSLLGMENEKELKIYI